MSIHMYCTFFFFFFLYCTFLLLINTSLVSLLSIFVGILSVKPKGQGLVIDHWSSG